ncbi:MAG: hypothetical protein ABIQ87_10810, partial [Rubrivivax sp.]
TMTLADGFGAVSNSITSSGMAGFLGSEAMRRRHFQRCAAQPTTARTDLLTRSRGSPAGVGGRTRLALAQTQA